MIVDNIYWGFDQSASKIFSLLRLLPGLFMAFFGAYYQTRRKKEIALKVGIILGPQFDAYEDIAATFSKLQSKFHQPYLMT